METFFVFEISAKGVRYIRRKSLISELDLTGIFFFIQSISRSRPATQSLTKSQKIRHTSSIYLAYLLQISGNSQVYLRQVYGQSQKNLAQISDTSQANLRQISGKSQANLRLISDKSLSNLWQIFGKSLANLWQI